jgi:hypothetical protein
VNQMQDELGRDDFNLQEAFVLGRETLKALLLVNGGGSVALLTFYGSLVSKEGYSLPGLSASLLTASLVCFAGGVFFAVLSTGFGYLTQLHWGVAAFHERDILANQRRAGQLHFIAILAAVLSVVGFLAGVGCAALVFLARSR